SVDLDAGPHLFAVRPAFQGAVFAGGHYVPSLAGNDLSRNEFIFTDPMGSDVVFEWRTATVTVGVVDQNAAAIAGATWGFAGEATRFPSATITAPITDESVYPNL